MRAVIIGGGAAGLFAAGWLVRGGVDTIIIEHSGELGRKILVTGKGRCNVTNDCDEPEFMKNVRTNPKFMYSSIYSFSPRKTMEFFENLGVPLKTERGRRVFPVSDKAADIRRALIKWADRAEVIYDDAGSIETEDGRVTGVKCVSGRTVTADRVLLATGGLSYRKTGSTGDGYRFARRLGHTIIEPTASLVPLVENEVL
ncbi:MAG: aminoacetone oxidase family FAD-binding enzyme [Oscillospiraceae bacterium]|nr:aminoacetone oxidase family FAD-binding enzyme [Oscillospiraceae bacterium]